MPRHVPPGQRFMFVLLRDSMYLLNGLLLLAGLLMDDVGMSQHAEA
jgi:hypothetical protein